MGDADQPGQPPRAPYGVGPSPQYVVHDDPSGARRLLSFNPNDGSAQLLSQIEPTRTKVAMDIKLAFAVFASLVAGGVAIGTMYQQMMYRVGGLEQQLSSLVRRSELTESRYEIEARLRRRFDDAVVRCPTTAPKGVSWVDCKLILPRDP